MLSYCSCLNKLSDENFEILSDEIANIRIDSRELLEGYTTLLWLLTASKKLSGWFL